MTEPLQVSDAEAYLLGAVMSGYPDLDDLAAVVEPADFYLPLHEAAWQAVLRVHHAGNKPDPLSVRLALADASVKHDPTRLVDYAQACPLPASAPYYAAQVATAAGLRRIQSAGVQLQQLGASVGDLAETRERARQVVDAATAGRDVSRARTLASLMPEVVDVAERGESPGLGTGWGDLDRVIGGLAPGRLVVFGARPGVGKSIVGTNLALHMAHRHGHAVLLASLEMPEREVGQRLLASHASVDLSKLQHGGLDDPAWGRIASKVTELQALPITVDDAPGQTVASIRRAARNLTRTRDDLALVVVDYLQLVRPADPRAGRVEALGEISRGLKLLARESGACVVAMAQVNREGAKRTDGRPLLTDLRESGSIEADADQVVLMHQPDEDIPEVEFNVDKNRHGPKSRVTLQMQGHYARFVETWTPRGAA